MKQLGKTGAITVISETKSKIYRNFARRLHVACDHVQLPKGRGRATALGTMMGVSYKGAGKWLDGGGMPDMGHASGLATVLGVSFEWLMTGRGVLKVARPTANTRWLSSDAARLVVLFETLPGHVRPQVRALFETQLKFLKDLIA